MTLPLCFGVFGDPVAHSRSPEMHEAAFSVLGLPHHYLPFHVPSARLPAALAGARALGFGGVNLTLPHKQAAMPAMDSLGAAARRIGAVNTVCFTPSGLVGHNTDGQGFAAAARELDPTPLRSALVLGAGGAALAVVDALLYELLVGRVRWVSRDPGALNQVLAGRPELRGRVLVGSYDDLVAGPLAADLLVNCTSVGMVSGPSSFPVPLNLETLAPKARVIDVVYPRRPGGLLDQAAGLGLRVQDGLPMLLWQGVRALELWLGEAMPLDVIAAMRAALTY